MGPGAPALRGKLGALRRAPALRGKLWALGNGAPALRGGGLRVGPWGPSTKRQAGGLREGPSSKTQAGGPRGAPAYKGI